MLRVAVVEPSREAEHTAAAIKAAKHVATILALLAMPLLGCESAERTRDELEACDEQAAEFGHDKSCR
jgi:hypothetical protein